MPGRTIAIGDIHGCATALAKLIERVAPQPDDMVITLGDYVDRGPNSREVIDQLIELRTRCRLVPLLGNHDEAMLAAISGEQTFQSWIMIGGLPTLESYGFRGDPSVFPAAHVEFLQGCLPYFETDSHFFVHANYNPRLALERQDRIMLRWLSLHEHQPGPHLSHKVAVLGHTAQPRGEYLYAGYLICIDTGCCYGDWLTALDVEHGQVWQTNEEGRVKGEE
jgi:serine/threonine protein phosphatase 1